MTTIYADFNALTEDDSIRLTTRGSQDDISKYGVKPGDWVWLDDGELQVGARVAEDPRYRLVAVPSWETMIDLIEESGRDSRDLMGEIQGLLVPRRRLSREEEKRLFDLYFRFERVAPRQILEIRPGFPAFRRAFSLHSLGEHGLALAEIEAARPAREYLDNYDYYYMEMLRFASPDLAFDRAVEMARGGDLTASGYVAAVNIAAIRAQELGEDRFGPIASLILDWSDRFERAPGRATINVLLLSLLHFNRGLVLLRLGRVAEGREALELARAVAPLEPMLAEATQLDAYDQKAREIASSVHARLWAA